MIPFEEIDKHLDHLGKDRAWLAAQTPYSPAYLRDVLAPNSSRRSSRVQTIISAAIERETDRQRANPALPDRISIEAMPSEMQAWEDAAAAEGLPLRQWMLKQLHTAAASPMLMAAEPRRKVKYPHGLKKPASETSREKQA